jgi:hypothetical protein
MHEELGITELKYDELLSDGVGISDIYEFLNKYNTGQVCLYYYADENGRFMPPKTNDDKIANAVFDNLTTAEKMNLLSYLEDIDDNKF